LALDRGVDQEDDQTTDGGTLYIQILISAKIKTGKAGKTIELTGRSPLRRRRSTLDCSVIYEEEQEQEEQEQEYDDDDDDDEKRRRGGGRRSYCTALFTHHF